jgi:hypothetical protein
MISDKGIAYHEMPENNGLWSITHIPSGRAILSYVSKSKVRWFAEAIDPMTDWNNTSVELLRASDIKTKIGQLQYQRTS